MEKRVLLARLRLPPLTRCRRRRRRLRRPSTTTEDEVEAGQQRGTETNRAPCRPGLQRARAATGAADPPPTCRLQPAAAAVANGNARAPTEAGVRLQICSHGCEVLRTHQQHRKPPPAGGSVAGPPETAGRVSFRREDAASDDFARRTGQDR